MQDLADLGSSLQSLPSARPRATAWPIWLAAAIGRGLVLGPCTANSQVHVVDRASKVRPLQEHITESYPRVKS